MGGRGRSPLGFFFVLFISHNLSLFRHVRVRVGTYRENQTVYYKCMKGVLVWHVPPIGGLMSRIFPLVNAMYDRHLRG